VETVQQQIRPARVRLEASARALSPFAAAGPDPLSLMASTLAHDINNILQVVSGNLSLLGRDRIRGSAPPVLCVVPLR
jgi:hypothetical protein